MGRVDEMDHKWQMGLRRKLCKECAEVDEWGWERRGAINGIELQASQYVRGIGEGIK